MVVGTVAEILHKVLVVDEALHAHPQRAFAAHLAQADIGAHFFLGPGDCQGRATDADSDQRSFRHHGRSVVRTARAKVRCAVHDRLYRDRGPRGRTAPVNPGAHRRDLRVGQDPRCDCSRDHAGWQIGIRAQQFGTIGAAFAKHRRRIRHPVELVLDGQLDERALFLDDNYLVKAVGELLHDMRLERRHHAQFKNSDT